MGLMLKVRRLGAYVFVLKVRLAAAGRAWAAATWELVHTFDEQRTPWLQLRLARVVHLRSGCFPRFLLRVVHLRSGCFPRFLLRVVHLRSCCFPRFLLRVVHLRSGVGLTRARWPPSVSSVRSAGRQLRFEYDAARSQGHRWTKAQVARVLALRWKLDEVGGERAEAGF